MNEKLNITFLLPSQGHGGGVRAITEFGNGLHNRDHNVRIVYKNITKTPTLKHLYHSIRQEKAVNWLDSFLGKIEPYSNNLNNIHLTENEIVVSMCSQTTLDAWELPDSIKKAFHCHGGEYENWSNFIQAINLPIHKIAISNHVKDMIQRHTPTNKIPVVPDGINHSEYFLDNEIYKSSIGGCIRPRHSKDSNTTIETFKLLHSKHPETPLLSFGIGKKPPIHSILKYTDNPTIDEGRAIYNKCKVWFLASLEEGFGLPVLEAMACGCIVVSTKCGGPQDLIIDGYNGYNVEIGNYGGIVEKISSLLTNDKLFQEMSKNAIKTAHTYSWEKSASLLEHALLHIPNSD